MICILLLVLLFFLFSRLWKQKQEKVTSAHELHPAIKDALSGYLIVIRHNIISFLTSWSWQNQHVLACQILYHVQCGTPGGKRLGTTRLQGAKANTNQSLSKTNEFYALLCKRKKACSAGCRGCYKIKVLNNWPTADASPAPSTGSIFNSLLGLSSAPSTNFLFLETLGRVESAAVLYVKTWLEI